MTQQIAVDQLAERAVIGGLMLLGDPRHVVGVAARGLRPEHFYSEKLGLLFKAAISLADRQAAVDAITLFAEIERMRSTHRFDRAEIDELAGDVPAAGHYAEYADRVIEMARWRHRTVAAYNVQDAIAKRDTAAYARASADLDHVTAGTRTESFSGEAWRALLWDYFAEPVGTSMNAYAVPTPFSKITDALGGGLWRGEWCALSGPTSFGKSVVVDQWLDVAAGLGLNCHLYMTEMTAIVRGMRYLSRKTGVPFMRQRDRRRMTERDTKAIVDGLRDALPYGCSIAADWSAEDIVRDALRARYDFVVVDLLHGFHYEDERGLDRLSKEMQRLARVSTTLDGHPGTAVVAVTHLKEEGLVKGRVPRPSISSIKGGSSIKQDADFVIFVWQEQDDRGTPTGEGEVWLPKARSGERVVEEVALVPSRFKFVPRGQSELATVPATTDAPF